MAASMSASLPRPLPPPPGDAARELGRALSLSTTVADLLHRRGHLDPDATRRFLEPKLRDLTPPDNMADRALAAERLVARGQAQRARVRVRRLRLRRHHVGRDHDRAAARGRRRGRAASGEPFRWGLRRVARGGRAHCGVRRAPAGDVRLRLVGPRDPRTGARARHRHHRHRSPPGATRTAAGGRVPQPASGRLRLPLQGARFVRTRAQSRRRAAGGAGARARPQAVARSGRDRHDRRRGAAGRRQPRARARGARLSVAGEAPRRARAARAGENRRERRAFRRGRGVSHRAAHQRTRKARRTRCRAFAVARPLCIRSAGAGGRRWNSSRSSAGCSRTA